MFKKRTLSLVLVAVLLASLLAVPSCKKSVETAQGVTKIYQETHINGRLTINQKGTDEILRLQDSGTDVWTVADGGAQSTGSDGAGYDVTWYSTTAGDKAMWDASAVALWITGTNGSTAFDVSDGDVVVADDLRITGQTAITVTNGAGFSPTGTYQSIQAGSEVTPTINVGAAGDLLVLINISTNVINLADTGIQMLSAAWAGGQYDVLVLWCDGTNWIEISRSDN